MKKLSGLLLCMCLLMTGCSGTAHFSASTPAPLATVSDAERVEMTSPAPETVKPTFPHKETEPETIPVQETEPESLLAEQLYQEISHFQTVIRFDRNISAGEISSAVSEMERNHPEIFWINGYSMRSSDVSSEITLKIINNYQPEELRQMAQILEMAAQTVLNSIGQNDSDYEKALAVHDYLVAHTEYDQAAVSQGKGLWSTAYGCLVNGMAVCQGYSQAFQLLMNRLGIECGICFGRAKEEDHAWNYINLNHQYYWIDVTWDDPVTENYNFDWIHHGYFLIDDAMLSRSRSLEVGEQFIPVCYSLDENYFVRSGNYLTEYYFSDIDSRLSAHAEEGRIEVMFAEQDAYQMAISDLFGSETIWNAQIFQSRGGNITYQQDDDMYILRLIFTVNH